MRKLLFAVALVAAAACSKKANDAPTATAAAAPAKIPAMTVDEVDQAVTAGQAQAVDCNGESTRKKEGVIPGAVLLTDDESFALGELPADKQKQLVFYCANTECGASHHAASKALTAG